MILNIILIHKIVFSKKPPFQRETFRFILKHYVSSNFKQLLGKIQQNLDSLMSCPGQITEGGRGAALILRRVEHS